MLRHHKLATEGAQAEGTVLQWSAGREISKAHLLIGVKFEDGEIVEFSEDVTDYYAVPGHVMKQVDLPPGDDVVPLPLYDGSKVPVRYDPSDRKKIMVDEATLHQGALEAFVQSKHAERAVREQQLRDS
jgi:hypothetical protein